MSRTFRKTKKGKVYQDKDKRKGVLHVSKGCNNHGWCSYCRGNRLHSYSRRKFEADIQIREIDASTLYR